MLSLPLDKLLLPLAHIKPKVTFSERGKYYGNQYHILIRISEIYQNIENKLLKCFPLHSFFKILLIDYKIKRTVFDFCKTHNQSHLIGCAQCLEQEILAKFIED